MRKRLIGEEKREHGAPEGNWLDVARAGEVELTSEREDAPIEAALGSGPGRWRAAGPGPQVIRLLFDEPQYVRRIHLVFDEPDVVRTQEFAVRWSPDGGHTWRDVVRQQWNFSPDGATREVEDFAVDLPGTTSLELRIVPDVSGGAAEASLSSLRLA
jgi:hypothetical protein